MLEQPIKRPHQAGFVSTKYITSSFAEANFDIFWVTQLSLRAEIASVTAYAGPNGLKCF